MREISSWIPKTSTVPESGDEAAAAILAKSEIHLFGETIAEVLVVGIGAPIYGPAPFTVALNWPPIGPRSEFILTHNY